MKREKLRIITVRERVNPSSYAVAAAVLGLVYTEVTIGQVTPAVGFPISLTPQPLASSWEAQTSLG